MRQFPLTKRTLLLGLGLLLLTWSIQTGAAANDAQQAVSSENARSVSAVEASPYTYFYPIVFATYPRGGVSRIPIYGVNFISSAEAAADEQQYQNGLATGATWNRWPMYWYRVEKSAGQFDWSSHDAVVQSDLEHGLQVNAILMGTPGFYGSGLSGAALTAPPAQLRSFVLNAANSSTPTGLHEPVFYDPRNGELSDVPGTDKIINDANVWARYVFAAVDRYRPGGVMARANNWPIGVGITHWEMWNEPDMLFFWRGTLVDYARLLKVGYLAAKHADVGARVLFGGLANLTDPSQGNYNFLNQVLDHYDGDPMAPANGYFFDILATHSYSRSWDAWLHVWRAKRSMTAHGLSKPVWMNETGVPAWDDYPGPMWDPASPLRATLSEQADHTIQTFFYATWAGAEAIFHFQLYDGCGNQPAGTDPPYDPSGGHCDANGLWNGLPCAGDAHGFYRNPTTAACFTHHPQPESARPRLAAFQLLTRYLTNVVPLWRQRPGGADPYNGPQEWIAFYRPATNERIVGMWARFGQDETAVIPAVNPAGTALLLSPDGNAQIIVAADGAYTIHLPGATNLNTPPDATGAYAIGGRPFLLVEPVSN